MKNTILLFALILFSSQSVAQPEGFYMGLGLLNGSYSHPSSSGSLGNGKLIFGEVTPDFITGELQLIDMDFDKSSGKTGDLQAKSLSYSILFHVDAGDLIYPFIKIGYNRWDTRYYTTDTEKTTEHGSNGFYGIGAQVSINKQWTARFEYESFSFKANNESVTINLNSLNILYQL